MIHAIYLENGRARYRNRWVLTKEVLEERAAGHRIYNSSFGAPPHADLANTNIVYHAGRYLALYEAGVPYEVDRDLNTVGLFDYNGRLPTVMSAHPKLDPATGELLSVAYSSQTGALAYLRADKTGRLDRIVPFQAPWPTMIHDISITERHVVAFMGPAVFDRSRAGPPVTWQPDRGSMVAVVPRDAQTAADVRWIKGAAVLPIPHHERVYRGQSHRSVGTLVRFIFTDQASLKARTPSSGDRYRQEHDGRSYPR